jgi:hypothetical protein
MVVKCGEIFKDVEKWNEEEGMNAYGSKICRDMKY